jgi:hypothetical protein
MTVKPWARCLSYETIQVYSYVIHTQGIMVCVSQKQKPFVSLHQMDYDKSLKNISLPRFESARSLLLDQ